MRALVMGALNDQRTKILLDTGANVTAITEAFAKKLRLKQRVVSHDMQINVRGIGEYKVSTQTKATVKVTLGWELAYEFDVCVINHDAVVDLILGTDFMIPAGIRLDLFNSTAQLPDEVTVPLLRSKNAAEMPRDSLYITDGPAEPISLPSRLPAEFKLRKQQPDDSTHDLWGCVRLNSAKYSDWQVLAYEAAIDKVLLKKERQLYGEWLARQPPAVERRPYTKPEEEIARPPEEGEKPELTCAQQRELIAKREEESAESAGRTDLSGPPATGGDHVINSASSNWSPWDDSAESSPDARDVVEGVNRSTPNRCLDMDENLAEPSDPDSPSDSAEPRSCGRLARDPVGSDGEPPPTSVELILEETGPGPPTGRLGCEEIDVSGVPMDGDPEGGIQLRCHSAARLGEEWKAKEVQRSAEFEHWKEPSVAFELESSSITELEADRRALVVAKPLEDYLENSATMRMDPDLLYARVPTV
ncbi:uncharacterized protein IUM83_12052 [Phytophthora cinnamomi]|uniref:uncharacterized protein n=1 Tax=Phytophthora cinnamomi TaxID=4785 RepID=UPI00355A0C5C|nr:hypothetical protein IUM83_12052 [Phytophthora cinnamomi]